ncbi:hypothetical protein OIU78_027196, partial [Salix suchowensis]
MGTCECWRGRFMCKMLSGWFGSLYFLFSL